MKKLVYIPLILLSLNCFATIELGSFYGRTKNGIIKNKCEIHIELERRISSRMMTSKNVYVITVASGNYSEYFIEDENQDFTDGTISSGSGDDNNFTSLEAKLDSSNRPVSYTVKSFNGAFGIGRTKTIVDCVIKD